MKVNLHTHSVKSDGVFTPEEVVKIQRDDGIEAMSLTDHDNVSGIDEAIRAGEKYGLKVLPGIELSCYSVCEIHILGYNFDYKNSDFVQDLENVKDLRRQRINKTVEKLHALNVPFDDSALDFENANLGRVHVAKEMVRQGLAKSVSDAFYQYLGSGKKAYIPGYRLRPMDGVKLIKNTAALRLSRTPCISRKTSWNFLSRGWCRTDLTGLNVITPPSTKRTRKGF